jgi:hypothetical protein
MTRETTAPATDPRLSDVEAGLMKTKELLRRRLRRGIPPRR